MPQNGVLCGLSTPWGPLWEREIWKKYMSCRIPRRTTYKKISQPPGCQMRHFWEKHVFSNFSRFLPKYRISVDISIIFGLKEGRHISINCKGVAGNYVVSIFFSTHQVDESRNQKCGTHIKKLAAMKFRNSEKLSYCSNQLEKTYLKKNLNWVKVQKSNYRETFFYFFIFLKNNFFVFENVENLIADSKRQCPTYWGRYYQIQACTSNGGRGAPSPPPPPPGSQVS